MKQTIRAFAPAAVAALVTLFSPSAPAQPSYLPASGANQRASVSQQVGPVTVTISYSSPRVVLKGDDRHGKIWGKLVPYGLTQLDFNDCKSCPWRAGANENTVFTVSDEVKVQGKSLPAGTYGLSAITGPDEWTFIFSKNASSWGAYWYDPKEDVLRVTAKPAKSEYHEWLTYDFVEREPAKATVALKWEELQVPFAFGSEGRGPARDGETREKRIPRMAHVRLRRARAGEGDGRAEVGRASGAVRNHRRRRPGALGREVARRAARLHRFRLGELATGCGLLPAEQDQSA